MLPFRQARILTTVQRLTLHRPRGPRQRLAPIRDACLRVSQHPSGFATVDRRARQSPRPKL